MPGADPKVYEEILDVEKLHAQVEEYLNDWNGLENLFQKDSQIETEFSNVCTVDRTIGIF